MPIAMVGPNDHYYVHIYFNDVIFCAVLKEEVKLILTCSSLKRL